MDKKDAFIAGFEEVLPANYHVLYTWHINKNIITPAKKYFSDPEQLKNWISLWYLVCEVPIL